MAQRELGCMQGLAREIDAMARAAAIDRIADQRMADVLEVHADLVRAAGLEATFDERGAAEALEDAIGGAGGLAAMRHRHARAHLRITTDRSLDGAACRRVTLHEGDVDAAH